MHKSSHMLQVLDGYSGDSGSFVNHDVCQQLFGRNWKIAPDAMPFPQYMQWYVERSVVHDLLPLYTPLQVIQRCGRSRYPYYRT